MQLRSRPGGNGVWKLRVAKAGLKQLSFPFGCSTQEKLGGQQNSTDVSFKDTQKS